MSECVCVFVVCVRECAILYVCVCVSMYVCVYVCVYVRVCVCSICRNGLLKFASRISERNTEAKKHSNADTQTQGNNRKNSNKETQTHTTMLHRPTAHYTQNSLQHTATYSSTVQHIAAHCNTLHTMQHSATLQHTATTCYTHIYTWKKKSYILSKKPSTHSNKELHFRERKIHLS